MDCAFELFKTLKNDEETLTKDNFLYSPAKSPHKAGDFLARELRRV